MYYNSIVFTLRRKSARVRTGRRGVSSFGMQIARGALFVGVVFLIGAGIFYGTRLDAVTIDQVVVRGGHTIAPETIEAQMVRMLDGAHIGLGPKRFVYAYPHDALVREVAEMPYVRAVDVTREGRELRVTFEEYTPAALWCRQGEDAQCYFVSEDGFAFAEAPAFKGASFMRHYVETASAIEKTNVVEAQLLADLEWFVDQLEEELGFRVTSILHKENKDIELSVSGGGAFHIASSKDIRTTYNNLRIVLTSSEYSHIRPGNFNYIDVRFDTKVFVNEQKEAVETLPE